MNRIEQLRSKVAELYQAHHPNRADWADWIYEGHVILVGNASRHISEKYGGSPELAEAAGLLHDIADAVMKREDLQHEEESFNIARTILNETGFTEDEIEIVVEDAIAKHSCYGDVRPNSLEGKAMAAGDGIVHITSNFYQIAEKQRSAVPPQEIAAWALPKIDRDFFNKIVYDDLRETVRPDYELLKAHFKELGKV